MQRGQAALPWRHAALAGEGAPWLGKSGYLESSKRPCWFCRDHTGGNLELKEKYKLKIVGPKADEERIPGIDVALADGETWAFGGLEMHVFDTPGHTRGHITLWFPEADTLFPGEPLPVLRVLPITSRRRACLQPLQGGMDL